MRAGGAVADCERLRQRPIVVDGAAGGDDGAQCVLQAEAVVGLLADFDVGNEAEHGSAPIGAAPGMRVVEALVAGRGLALRHIAHHVVPNFLAR